MEKQSNTKENKQKSSYLKGGKDASRKRQGKGGFFKIKLAYHYFYKLHVSLLYNNVNQYMAFYTSLLSLYIISQNLKCLYQKSILHFFKNLKYEYLGNLK